MGEPLLLSVDFEDWHQLVRRRVGAPNWREPGPALARQTEAMLALFEELGVRCTFFVLAMAARAHPELVRAVAEAGHEIACHGDEHRPVHTQTPQELAADLRRARETIEELTGQRPIGYRAPAFSITRRSEWAFEVLAKEGFAYDASQSDTFVVRDRISPLSAGPHRLPGSPLWEFPVAVWRLGRRVRLPLGGASYWSVTPLPMVLRGLDEVGRFGGLYLHPHELDPEPLDSLLPRGADVKTRLRAAARGAQRNAARRRAPGVLRAIAERHPLIAYGEAHVQLGDGAPAGT